MWTFRHGTLIMTSNMPLCLTQMSKNSFVVFIIVVVILVAPNLANLENLSTTTMMVSFFQKPFRCSLHGEV